MKYMAGDHPSTTLRTNLGSTSITTDNTGAKVSEMRYKPWGEVRYSWTAGLSTTPAYKLANYTFTGQYSYTADFGLMFYNARWYDPALGRFAQADTIVPGGVQGLDRYAYANNSPMMYVDPTGHYSVDQIRDYLKNQYGNKWRSYYDAWESDDVFWDMLLAAQNGDVLQAPTTNLGNGLFMDDGNGGFTFVGEHQLYEYQGYGPYDLMRNVGDSPTPQSILLHPVCTNSNCPLEQADKEWDQPIYDYSSGAPVSTGYHRVVKYEIDSIGFNPWGGDSVPWLVSGPVTTWLVSQAPKALARTVLGPVSVVVNIISVGTFLNNSTDYIAVLTVNYEDRHTYLGPPGMTPPVNIPPQWIDQKDK